MNSDITSRNPAIESPTHLFTAAITQNEEKQRTCIAGEQEALQSLQYDETRDNRIELPDCIALAHISETDITSNPSDTPSGSKINTKTSDQIGDRQQAIELNGRDNVHSRTNTLLSSSSTVSNLQGASNLTTKTRKDVECAIEMKEESPVNNFENEISIYTSLANVIESDCLVIGNDRVDLGISNLIPSKRTILVETISDDCFHYNDERDFKIPDDKEQLKEASHSTSLDITPESTDIVTTNRTSSYPRTESHCSVNLEETLPPPYNSLVEGFLKDAPPNYENVTGIKVNINEVAVVKKVKETRRGRNTYNDSIRSCLTLPKSIKGFILSLLIFFLVALLTVLIKKY